MPTFSRLLAGLAVLLLTPLAPGQVVDLRPKFEQGQEHRFKMEVSSASTIEQPQMEPEKQSIKMEIGLLLRVVEAPPEQDATVELVYESLKVAVAVGTGIEEFDSSKPASQDADSRLAPMMRPMVGTVLTLTVDPNGNIKRVAGGEGLTAVGPAANLAQPSGVKQLLGPIMTSKQSPGLVRIGESWENVDTVDSGMLGSFKMTTKHTLRSAAGEEARLAFTGRLEPATEAPGASLVQVRSSAFDGQYVWDTRRGMLRSMDSTQATKMDLDMAGQKISVSTEGTTKVSRAGN